MSTFRSGYPDFSPSLIIFDKDGTLIDFNFMWASWVTELAARLERAAGRALARELYAAMGYDELGHRVIAGSPLAAHSMADLCALTARVARAAGLAEDAADRVAQEAWFIPDPVALARPLGQVKRVFSTLRARGILVGIATSDDRGSTTATLRALGVMGMVNALVSADDGLPNKPAPDMLLSICRELRVQPASSMMVGDSVADMEAARAAGMGLRVGVLSGVSSRQVLESHADVIIDSIDYFA
jgi:HAD superfamily hydrolase (TIGR01549 family)